tara:strand:- start:607 stop:1407 length:801 start_codon:yes stop_codon:yes gene_type:complete
MAVPSSGSVSMLGIFSEKNEDDYGAANIDGENGISLRGLSSNSYGDTASGGNINLNTGYASSASGGANLVNAPYAISEFRGYDHDAVVTNTTATITSGYTHALIAGPRGGNRYVFSKGYVGPSPTPTVSAPPSGSISNSNIILTGGTLGVITSLAHYTVGPGGSVYIRLIIYNTSASANSGFTNMVLTQTALSNTLTLSRTSAFSFAHSSSNNTRTWLWYYTPTTSGYSNTVYQSVTQSGFTSKLFGDLNTGTGTDSNPRTTAVFS